MSIECQLSRGGGIPVFLESKREASFFLFKMRAYSMNSLRAAFCSSFPVGILNHLNCRQERKSFLGNGTSQCKVHFQIPALTPASLQLPAGQSQGYTLQLIPVPACCKIIRETDSPGKQLSRVPSVDGSQLTVHQGTQTEIGVHWHRMSELLQRSLRVFLHPGHCPAGLPLHSPLGSGSRCMRKS